jgi:hypothetical protein
MSKWQEMMRYVLAALGFACCLTTMVRAQPGERVDFFTDAILDEEDGEVRLKGGSSWLLDEQLPASAASAVVVVVRSVEGTAGAKTKTVVFYVGDHAIGARQATGSYAATPGWLTTALRTAPDGSAIHVADGSSWFVKDADRAAVRSWAPPYPALVSRDERFLYNLAKATRVNVSRAQAAP